MTRVLVCADFKGSPPIWETVPSTWEQFSHFPWPMDSHWDVIWTPVTTGQVLLPRRTRLGYEDKPALPGNRFTRTNVLKIYLTCVGHVLDFCWTCLRHVMEMLWIYVRHFLHKFGYVFGMFYNDMLDMFWTCAGHAREMLQTCFGHVFEIFYVQRGHILDIV